MLLIVSLNGSFTRRHLRECFRANGTPCPRDVQSSFHVRIAETRYHPLTSSRYLDLIQHAFPVLPLNLPGDLTRLCHNSIDFFRFLSHHQEPIARCLCRRALRYVRSGASRQSECSTKRKEFLRVNRSCVFCADATANAIGRAERDAIFSPCPSKRLSQIIPRVGNACASVTPNAANWLPIPPRGEC